MKHKNEDWPEVIPEKGSGGSEEMGTSMFLIIVTMLLMNFLNLILTCHLPFTSQKGKQQCAKNLIQNCLFNESPDYHQFLYAFSTITTPSNA